MAKERAHILVVDDEEILLDLVSEVLEDHGFIVTALTSAPHARDVFLGRPSAFDLVVADELMPELSGTDLAKEILAIRPDIPVILYTDYPEVSIGEKGESHRRPHDPQEVKPNGRAGPLHQTRPGIVTA